MIKPYGVYSERLVALGLILGLFIVSVDAQAEHRATVAKHTSLPSTVSVVNDAEQVTFSNSIVKLIYRKASGLYSLYWNESPKISGAYSVAEINGRVTSTSYRKHTFDSTPKLISDGYGKGKRFTIVNSSENGPDMLQHFTLYEGKPFLFVQTELRGSSVISTNHMGVIVTDTPSGVSTGSVGDVRVLHVPFDNDMWFRYNAMDITPSASVAGSSCETTAMYDNASRNGLVLGSVTHDKWKTAVQFTGSRAHLDHLEVFGGVLAPTGINSDTHDSQPHGSLTGHSISSPLIFVGYYDDWRDGLEEYGRANAVQQPPMHTKDGVPFGWNSWAAFTDKINYTKFLGTIDSIKALAELGFHDDRKVVYVNLDSFWTSLDATQLLDASKYIKEAGRGTAIEYRPGIYLAPFATWTGDLDTPVEGTGGRYHFRDILLRGADGNPLPKVAGGYALDPTHPGTQARIRAYFDSFRLLGFRFVKLDFMSHGSLEGVHYDKSVESGIEAYNQGMKVIREAAGDQMFISLSIAPLFPGGYAHARRLSCDVKGHISGGNETTEYMLNSLSYGWWSHGTVYYADGDEMPLGTRTDQGARNENEARSRVISNVIAGGMLLDSSVYDDGSAQELARKVYLNPRLNALAGTRRVFRPVEGNSGDHSADMFYAQDGDSYYVAVFNFNFDSPAKKRIDFARIAKALTYGKDVEVLDVVSGESQHSTRDGLTLDLAPAESRLLKLRPAPVIDRGADRKIE